MLHGGIRGPAWREGCQPCVFKMSLCASARSAALVVCGLLCVLRLGSERRKWNLQTVKSNVEKNGDIFPDLGPRLPESHSIGALIVHKVVRLYHLVRYFLNALL